MEGITFDYIDEYLRTLISKDEDMEPIISYARENNVPIIQPEGARFLETMIDISKPKRILELGTAIGYSSIIMCRAYSECSVVTIERNEEMIRLAKENIENFKLFDRIKILEGDALEILQTLDDKFDMVFMDAGKGHYNHFLPEVLRLLKDEGIIIADNVLFRGMIASNELLKRRKITIVKRMKNYLELVNSEEFITSVIPIGDGIAITKRRSSNGKK